MLNSDRKDRIGLVGALAICCWLFAGSGIASADWGAQLVTGQFVTVDPDTRQAIVRSGLGAGRPLWDGVHRLADGATITVRSGIVVPNAAMQRALPPRPQQSADPTAHPPSGGTRRWRCNELVLRSCGLRNRCGDAESCHLAVQLRTMQHGPGMHDRGAADWAEQRCREALNDAETFPACRYAPALEELACGGLADRVCCGSACCPTSPSCSAARELLDLEERALAQGALQELEVIRPRCVELLAQQAFFPPCR